MAQERKRIIVLGGYGSIGSQVCSAVSQLPYVECVVAGRSLRRARKLARQIGATPLQIQAEDAGMLERKLAGAFLVIDLAGSFQRRTAAVARHCARNGIHYIDLSDDRDYTAQVLKLDAETKGSGSVVVTGAGSLPGLASVLVDSLRDQFSSIEEIHAHISFGVGDLHGGGSIDSLLTKAGCPIRVKDHGRWRQAAYWTEPQRVQFPEPIGRRRTWLVDVPASDVFAQRYEAETIEFHAGAHGPAIRAALALMRRMRRGDTPVSARVARMASWLARMGSQSRGRGSGIVVFIKGVENDDVVTHSVALVEQGEGMSGIVIGLVQTLVRRWIEVGVPEAGAVGAVGLLSLDEMKPVLIEHDVKLVRA